MTTLVENMVKNNRNRFSIAVLLTTPICCHKTTANLFSWFYNCNFELPGHVIHRWKGILKTFWRYIKSPQILKILVGKPRKQTCIPLVTADQGGQKNRNGKTIAVLFYHVFY
jgi:hypothetical protein